MKKIFIAIVALTCLVCIGVFAYFHFFSPESRAKSISESYMKALLASDSQKAATLYPVQVPKSEILQRNYKLEGIAAEGMGTHYLLYAFADEKEPSKIRIEINDGVIKNIKSGNRLGNIPSDDAGEDTTQIVNESKCLAKQDLAYVDSESVYARNIRGATMIFPSESTDYIASTDSDLLLDRATNFYKKASQKDFVFELRGYRQNTGLTQEVNEQLDSLFQRRAVTLQKDLTDRGVPLDRILINDRYNYYTPSATSDSGQYIDINIVNRCIKT